MNRDKERANAWLQSLDEMYRSKLTVFATTQLWRTGLEHSAEDCVQETLSTAYEKYEELKDHPYILGWLYKATENYCHNELRKFITRSKREAFRIDAEGVPEVADLSAEAMIWLALDDDEAEKKRALKYLKKSLTPEEFRLYEEVYSKDISTKELAGQYRITQTAMSMRILRLHRKLMKLLRIYFDKMC